MYKLKAVVVAGFLGSMNINCKTFKNFDVTKLVDYIDITSHLKYNNRFLVYKIYEFYNYTNVSTFSKLPRCFTYNMAEFKFLQNEFSDDQLYHYNEPIVKIKIEYCKAMLSVHPAHAKTKKLLLKYEKEHPEYFI